MEVATLCEGYDVIGVDEGQFFQEIVEFCELLANQGKTVVVSALDGTFERKPFGNIINLIPLA
jgi:thymidine kinase